MIVYCRGEINVKHGEKLKLMLYSRKELDFENLIVYSTIEFDVERLLVYSRGIEVNNLIAYTRGEIYIECLTVYCRKKKKKIHLKHGKKSMLNSWCSILEEMLDRTTQISLASTYIIMVSSSNPSQPNSRLDVKHLIVCSRAEIDVKCLLVCSRAEINVKCLLVCSRAEINVKCLLVCSRENYKINTWLPIVGEKRF